MIRKNIKYYVRGMHCGSCETLIEREMRSRFGTKEVRFVNNKEEVIVNFRGKIPKAEELNNFFSKRGYVFSCEPFKNGSKSRKDYLIAFGITASAVVIFVLLNRLGIMTLSLTTKSSLLIFFVFGVVASFSSCAALVGGVVLSMSKQWYFQFGKAGSFVGKIKPHLIFSLGRIFSFVLLGAILGALGSRFQISLSFSAIVIVLVSLMMILFGFQMLGINLNSRLGLSAPKFVKKQLFNEKGLGSRKTPFVLGALTVFLPCGFTITAQSVALLMGSSWLGALAMLAFVLGTTPVLLAIGISSVKFLGNPILSSTFSKVAGMLIVFFAVFNINAQLNVLGYPSLSDMGVVSKSESARLKADDEKSSLGETKNKPSSQSKKVASSVEIVDGKQVIKMRASSRGYSPNRFEVKVGVSVLWEITDAGASGCTNAVIAPGLFKDQIALKPGKTVTKEFVPEKTGNFKFSCWMGMVSGMIKVVEDGA